ncbi:hypothetical protein GCK72_018133 [Caenorhabditis remanei]|uniref:7TM GPCR serpentine receptor class x (Srx) domain-containing protein n=1 Tax=Caenorhabditis remanei TaxID=31234 RepID=A0A6A5GAW6_CAERE|nr:hypothetical protein GCK72_018133 [Caenorhabditis remanei]KAF1751579.1 hypothetical protein GCK72_018133 [Caenorhabditis remanei]
MNSSESPADFRSWPNSVAAFLMTVDVVFGIFLSGAVVYIYFKDTQQRTSFNFICAVRATNNILVLVLAFVFVYIPGSIL